MITREDDSMATEQLLRECAEDWALLLAIRERLPRRVARSTRIPETNVRRWSHRFEAGAA